MSLATPGARTGALEAIERILNREGEADVILRAAVVALAERLGDALGGHRVRRGGRAGPRPDRRRRRPSRAPRRRRAGRVPRRLVAEIWIDDDGRPDADDQAFLRRVADLLSPYCLVGWDTGGEAWDV